MTYNKTLLGKIRYACPSCGEVLLSKVSDVGTKDACPSCSTSYVVPGLPERRIKEAATKASAAKVRRQMEAERTRSQAKDAAAFDQYQANAKQLNAEKAAKAKADAERANATPNTTVVVAMLLVASVIMAGIGMTGFYDFAEAPSIMQQIGGLLWVIALWIPAAAAGSVALLIHYRR